MHATDPIPNLLERIRRSIWPYREKLNLPAKYVLPIFSVCLGYKANDGRGKWGGRISLGDSETQSLYYNGVLFVRFALPFLICLQIRWSGKPDVKRQYLQTHIGWRLTGAFAIAFRIQCDESAATGTTGPNYGQAVGWADGTK